MQTAQQKTWLGVASLAVALLLAGAGCGSSDTTNSSPVVPPVDGYTAYDVADFGFKLQYPGDWEKAESDEDGGKVVQLIGPAADDNDPYRENIAILKYDVTKPEQNNLKSFEAFAQQGLSFVKDIKFTDKGSVTIGGFPGAKAEATGTLSDGSEYRWMQYYVVGKNKGVVFTFTDVPETFDSHIDTVNKIVSTVEFK